MPGIRQMRDSLTYQAIRDEGRLEGRVEEARSLLFQLGERRFGPPDEPTRDSLTAIVHLGRLHALVMRAHDVTTWGEQLGGTPSGRAS